ncbi:hypothetical protein GCM10009736_32270 [Actinomadura bangladeshensis]
MVALTKVRGVTHHDLHHEIHLSDPRETALEEMRMILRQDRRAAVRDPPPDCSPPRGSGFRNPRSRSTRCTGRTGKALREAAR